MTDITAPVHSMIPAAILGSKIVWYDAVTVNGMNVNVDAANLLDSLKTPRVLYMWQGQ